LKIVVLAGGLSPERNVSLSSGVMVATALRERGHRVALIDLFFGLENWKKDPEALYEATFPQEWRRVDHAVPDLAAIQASRGTKTGGEIGPGVLELCAGADGVFLALHGACGEDGRLQAALDLRGVPYTGSGYLASAIAMDKDLTKRVLAPAGILTPQWEVVEPGLDVPAVTARTALPCVVKPVDSGSSIGVSIAHTREELAAALAAITGRTVLERYVAGREIQVGVLEDRALPSIEIIPKVGFYDYENKYQPGAAREVCPAPVPPAVEAELEALAVKVHSLVGLSVYSRSDFILDGEGRIWFLEINTLPGMTPTSLLPQEAAAVGIDYGALTETIFLASLEARKSGQ